MYINDPEVPKEVIDKICCLKTVEQVLGKSLKEIQQFKNIELDNTITLSTGGTPLSLQIRKKPTLKTISTQTFYNIKRKHDMSDYTIDSIAMELRKDLDLVYVKDPVSLVNHVCIARGLEVENVIIRIRIDSGQGSLKIIINVFNREVNYDSKETKNTGVNKVIILAFAKNVCESHTNLQILIEKTKLNNLKFYLAADLKLCNIVLGLSGHGGKYSCLFCDGDKTNLGELRTFNMLKNTYKNFAESGFKKSSMQLYKNVIHPCLLVESGEMYVLDVIPPPELHLMMKIITEISNVFCKEPDVALWLKKHGIIWHGYNGGGLDGRNANKIRKLLPNLEKFILDNFSSYYPVVELLKSFSSVVNMCFGMKLHDGYADAIATYIRKLKENQEYVKTTFNHNLSMGWKGHIIEHHLVMFLNRTKLPLGVFSEQCSESVHHNMLKTLSRFSTSEFRENHGELLRKAIVEYSSHRI
ncbi:uncharacterized protein LOC124811228 [Hydra vulgaris]|uniref:uncharacterized protein LOC124811228 n=1 Tax=Hydra vulgaris TaxID=6087 RepID=UPI0032E9FA1F